MRGSQLFSNLVTYDDVFEGLGCLLGEYHIEIDTKIPVQHSPQRAPVALKEKLKQKLQELESKGIIAKVEKSTPCISSLVAVLKPGKIWVCIDPREMNKPNQMYEIPDPNSGGTTASTHQSKDFFQC